MHIVDMTRRIAPFGDAFAFAAILRHLRAHRYEVVHTHSAKAGFLGRMAARLAHVPWIVHTPHGYPFEMDVPRPFKLLYFVLEKFCSRFTDRTICVCPHEARTAAERGLVAPANVAVIENGLRAVPNALGADGGESQRELARSPGDLCVGTVGRFSRQKGHRYLIEAARTVVSRFPRVRFFLAGEGELQKKLERKIRRLGLGSYFRMPGQLRDVGRLYETLDVYVSSSLWEGLPYTVLEAMQAGKPVVATAVGGVPDIITNEETGLLVPPRDASALAEKICQLLADPDTRRRLGTAATGTVHERYGAETMVRRIEDVYRAVLDEKPGTCLHRGVGNACAGSPQTAENATRRLR